MSLGTLWFLCCCYLMYRLGRFDEKYPGRKREMIEMAWAKLYRWLTTN